jgi:hypothetical protein
VPWKLQGQENRIILPFGCSISVSEVTLSFGPLEYHSFILNPKQLPNSVSVGHDNFQQSTAVVFEVIGRTTVSKMAPSEIVVRSFKGSSTITLIGSGFMRNMIFMVNELGCFSEFLSS